MTLQRAIKAVIRPGEQSGYVAECFEIPCRFGFEVVSQRASHIKLRRVGPRGERESLTVPHHSELDTNLPGHSSSSFTLHT